MRRRPGRRAVGLAAGALGALATGGCTDYLARRDSLALGAGDAVQTNIATHVIDPWPRRAFSTDPTTSGERSARAIERYRNPQTGGGGASPPAATLSSPLGTGSGTSPGTGSSLVR